MSPNVNVRHVSLEVFPVTPINAQPRSRSARSDRTSALRRSDPSRRPVLMRQPLRARSLFMTALPWHGHSASFLLAAVAAEETRVMSDVDVRVLTVEFKCSSTARLQFVSMITLHRITLRSRLRLVWAAFSGIILLLLLLLLLLQDHTSDIECSGLLRIFSTRAHGRPTS